MSISSTVVSFISYFQNIGCTISLPSIKLPEGLQKALDSVRNFMTTIQRLIPSLPPFDIRSQLIIMSLGVPLALDIIFVWFIQPISTTIFHIIDIAAIFAMFMFISQGFNSHSFPFYYYIIIAVGGCWVVGRWIVQFITRKKKGKYSMMGLCRNICNHFMSNIIPGMKMDTTLNDLNRAVQRFSAIIEIKPQPVSAFSIVILFVLSALLLCVSFWCMGIIPIPIPLPKEICDVFPLVGLPLGGIFFIIFVLRIFPCGRKFILWFKQFSKRWGLRLLMLSLDLLYIPILSSLVSHIMVTNSLTCPVGEYRKILPPNSTVSPILDMLITHQTECVVCNESNITDEMCGFFCNAPAELRMQDDPSLSFFDDIVKVSGGFLVFGIIVVMIGIPSLWFFVIHRNKTFAFNVKVFGQDPQDKWLHLSNRMKTTGIFLFVNYKFNTSAWSVFYLCVKFLVMLITTISGRMIQGFVFVLPIFYLLVFVVIVVVRPYMYLFNNILDSILYGSQFIFSLVPCFAYFGILIPPAFMMPLSIILFIVPVVSIIFLLFFKRKSANFDLDPTFPQKLTEDEEVELENKRRKAMRLSKRKEQTKNAVKNQQPKNAPFSDDKDEEDKEEKNKIEEEEKVKQNDVKNNQLNLSDSSSSTSMSANGLHSIPSVPVSSAVPSSRGQIEEAKSLTCHISPNGSSPLIGLKLPKFKKGRPSCESTPDLISKFGNKKKGNNNNNKDDDSSESLENMAIIATSSPLVDIQPEENVTEMPVLSETNMLKQELIPEQDLKKEGLPKKLKDEVKSDTKDSKIMDLSTKKKTIKKNKEDKATYQKFEDNNKDEKNKKKSKKKKNKDGTKEGEENEEEEKNVMKELKASETICWIPEDEYVVQPGDLDTIQEAIISRKKNAVNPDDQALVIAYSVNKRVLANRMDSMYQMLDVVVDGSTIDFLTLTLSFAIMFGCGAFGWYIGAQFVNYHKNIYVVCD